VFVSTQAFGRTIFWSCIDGCFCKVPSLSSSRSALRPRCPKETSFSVPTTFKFSQGACLFCSSQPLTGTSLSRPNFPLRRSVFPCYGFNGAALFPPLPKPPPFELPAAPSSKLPLLPRTPAPPPKIFLPSKTFYVTSPFGR